MLILDLQFFGGRGASSSSGGGGSGASVFAANVASANNNATSNDDAQADDTTQAQAMGASYDVFMQMSDDDKADYIAQAVAQGAVPDFLAQNDFQKFLYHSGMNDRPQLVSDSALDAMNGTEVFRTVNLARDTRHGYTYTADQVAAQITKGTITKVSDTGGSAYGRGLYFADNYHDSVAYGNTRGDIKRTAVVRGKLNSNARLINYNTASHGASNEIRSRSKLGRVLGRMDTESAISTYALAKGYNVITSGHSYINILNRNAVTMSSTYKAKGSKW